MFWEKKICFYDAVKISRKWEKHPGNFYEMEFSLIKNICLPAANSSP
jgi:hypothetical protein